MRYFIPAFVATVREILTGHICGFMAVAAFLDVTGGYPLELPGTDHEGAWVIGDSSWFIARRNGASFTGDAIVATLMTLSRGPWVREA